MTEKSEAEAVSLRSGLEWLAANTHDFPTARYSHAPH